MWQVGGRSENIEFNKKKNIHLSGTFKLLCFQMSNFIIRIQSTVQSAGNPRNSSIQTKIKALNCKQITLNLYVFALNSSLSAPFIKIFLLQFIPTNIHNLPQIFYFQNVNGNWIQNENVLLIEWKKKEIDPKINTCTLVEIQLSQVRVDWK